MKKLKDIIYNIITTLITLLVLLCMIGLFVLIISAIFYALMHIYTGILMM